MPAIWCAAAKHCTFTTCAEANFSGHVWSAACLLAFCCQADVYSLGVTIWQMVERRRPFEGMDGMQICALWISDPGQMVLPSLTVADNACEWRPLLHAHGYHLPLTCPVCVMLFALGQDRKRFST
jgi:serine/threonine protein kinase